MDKGVPGKEALNEVTRESLIAISYSEPEKNLTSDKWNGETLVKAIDDDGEDKFSVSNFKVELLKRLEASLADLKGTLAELEEELNQKEGPEIEEARTIIAEVDKLFQTTEA
ncbi:hypothetical protein ACLB2K_077151 [Fragaria x ananassa]